MKKTLLLTTVAAVSFFSALATSAQADGPVSSYYGNISPFYGTINPFYGTINPFYGTINPFYGTINPFWGNITPFWGQINPFYGTINPFYGNISPFWGQINPFSTANLTKAVTAWTNVGPEWDDISSRWRALPAYSDAAKNQYDQVRHDFNDDVWHDLHDAWDNQVKKVSNGKGFDDAFGKAFLLKWGLDLGKKETFIGWTDEKRSRFIIDLYDNLMNFTGVDHVDHWMGAIHWNPAMTQDMSQGAATTIGILDASIAPGTEMYGNVQYAGGYTVYTNDHGAEVASLIFSQVDGKGVMGIAPNARVMSYNPFDASGTASFDDVRTGVITLASKGANVINMSLGVPGSTLHQSIANIFMDPSLTDQLKNTVFVIAAGNDGMSQTADLNVSPAALNNNYILVGSARFDQTISPWSNTPGTACVLTDGVCQAGNRLMDHFIVAPGELLLVSDNHGGLVRQSGTSFAAPLVSGTLTLMYNRWPWLQQHPQETVQMVLQSATDLGAPGVDPVYGWGMLNVQGALSPLNFNNLAIYQGASTTAMASSELKAAILSAGQLGTWEASGAYLYALENVGSTYRDFAIPLSSQLYGKDMNRNGLTERFQRYMYSSLITWANSASLTDIESFSSPEAGDGNWKVAATAFAADPYAGNSNGLDFAPSYVFHNASTGLGFQFGYGAGTEAFAARDGFGLRSDYSVTSGGVNPIVSFATGGAYAGGSVALSKSATLTLGYTEQHETNDPNTDVTKVLTHAVTPRPAGISSYNASAMVLGLALEANDWLKVDTNYTQLHEATGLLGVQGGGALSLSGGATTDAFTFDTQSKLGSGFTLATSATFGSSRPTTFANSALALAQNLRSTAFAVALNKTGVFDKTDAARLSLTQPLHIESGALSYTSYRVVDRQTGELGFATDTWQVRNGERQLLAEMLYARPVLHGAVQVSFSAEKNLNPDPMTTAAAFTVASRLSFKF